MSIAKHGRIPASSNEVVGRTKIASSNEVVGQNKKGAAE
jgi:hypothetical protein